MTREMVLFNLLALGLGVILVAGLDGIATPQPAPPRSHYPIPEVALLNLSLLHPEPVDFERRNPFAPPLNLTPLPTREVVQLPVNIHDGGVQALTSQPIPHPTVPRRIQAYTPAEIPVTLRGVLAVPGRSVEAQLTTQDGGQITVQVGSEIPVAVGNAGFQTVKIVDISGGDVIVERDSRRTSLRALLANP